MSKRADDLSLLEHVKELRVRLIKSVVAIILATCVVYAFIDPILEFVIRPVGRLIFTSVADAFVARIILSLLGGVLVSLPYTLFHIWQFVSVGLKDHEKKYIILFAPTSFLLFICGVLFGYFVMIPIALNFLLSFATESMVPMITIKNYISFVGMLILAFGTVFELPLILLFLTKIGIATPEFLIQKRKHAVVLMLIVSALITPPDIITQLMMAGPLIVLYEIGILVSKFAYQKNP